MSSKINVDYMFLYPEVIFKPFERKNKIPFEYRAYLKQQFNFLKRQYSQSKEKK